MKKIHIFLVALVAVILVGAGVYVAKAQTSMSNPNPVVGWAWASNVGWISFSSTNNTGGSAYGVYVATTTSQPTIAAFDGYAYSGNIGWISFKPADVSGCPTDVNMVPVDAARPCDPLMNMTNGQVTGWARILSLKDYDGSGWLQLSGKNHTTGAGGSGGVKLDAVTGAISQSAFESSAIGWLSFDASTAVSNVCIKGMPACPNSGGPTLSCSVTAGNLPSDGTGSATIVADVTGGSGSYTFTLHPNYAGSSVQTKTDPTHVSFSQSYPANGTTDSISYAPSVSVTSSGGTLPSPASVTCNNAVTVAGGGNTGGGGATAHVYIGSTVNEINTTNPKPTYLEIKAGDPIALEWDVPAGYTCTTRDITRSSNAVLGNGLASNWTGSVSGGTATLATPPLDTSDSSKGTYDFNLKGCSKTASDGTVTNIANASAQLLIFFSTVGEK